MNKLLALTALAGTTALLAATTAPAGNVALLQRYNLAPLLLTVSDEASGSPMNGFFGADRYRIELVPTKVQRDPRQPGRYQVWGKDRFKGRVTPFAGTVTFAEARQIKAPEDRHNPTSYVAIGTYELRETGSGAGTFQGRIAVDFMVEPFGRLHDYYNYDGPAKGGGILYDGTWTSTTGQVKPAVWVANIWSYHGPQVFQDFIVGERSRHFNAKYAKLGWNNYWRNDEWWASSKAM